MRNPRLSRLLQLTPALAAMSMIVLGGCKKHAEGDGHDHDSSAKQSSAHGKEADEHGQNHGEGEEAHADEVKLTGDAVERYGIKVEPAQLWALRPTTTTPARVAFNTEAMAHVGSPLRGRIAEVKVRLGDSVTAGQELLIIESPELGEAQADLLQKRIAAETAGPTVELARVSWERGKALYEQSQGLSLTEVQQREAQYTVAVAGQKSADAAAAAAANRLQLLGMSQDQIQSLVKTGQISPRFSIKAAIDGTVVQRDATLGELVSPDSESLLVLADTHTLWVLADVPEAKLPGLVVGNKAWVTLGSQTLANDEGAKPPMFEGAISFIAPLIDPTTRTAQVRIEVPVGAAGGATLKPGMFAQAEIVLHTGEAEPTPQVAVPDEAIQTVEGGPAIFVPVSGEPNTYAKRAVTIGSQIGGLIPIWSGLVEGEQFVSKGTFILKAELGKGSAAHEH